MSGLSRLRSRSRRSARQAAYSLRNNYGGERIERPKPIELPKDPFETLIKENDTMLMFETDDIIPSKYRWSSTKVRNDLFNDYNQKINCGRVILIYSPKKKLYLFMAINEDYTSYILFKAKSLKDLPVEKLYNSVGEKYKTIEQSNLKMIGILRYEPVWDLTLNPVILYKPTELFRK